MAINPGVTYGTQVDTSTDPTGYPYGKARNISVTGDGTGTPWEEQHVSDLWGFLQSLLVEAGLSPSGNPDKVGASQYLEAIQILIGRTRDYCMASLQGSSVGYTEEFTPAIISESGGFVVSGTDIIIPTDGEYEVAMGMACTSTDTTNPLRVANSIYKNSGVVRHVDATRWSANTAHYLDFRCPAGHMEAAESDEIHIVNLNVGITMSTFDAVPQQSRNWIYIRGI